MITYILTYLLMNTIACIVAFSYDNNRARIKTKDKRVFYTVIFLAIIIFVFTFLPLFSYYLILGFLKEVRE